MPNAKTSSQDWFYHAPKAKSAEAITQLPPASQVPGLGDHKPFNEEELYQDLTLRRKWIRDTDSDYVKLAKAGGRKDLFQYREHKSSERGAKDYPRVDWFDHVTPPKEEIGPAEVSNRPAMPSWYVHDEYVCDKDDFVPPRRSRPLLGFDDLSVWKREEQEQKKKASMLPSIHRSNNKTTTKKPDKARESKLPRISSGQDGGEMGQLLSMSYQTDWLNEQQQRRQRDKEAKTEERKRIQEMRDRDQEYIDRKKKKDPDPETKPLFKISKFNSVSSRVDSFRT